MQKDESGRKSKRYCCVVGCNNSPHNTSSDVRFYTFPNRPWLQELRQKWVQAVRRINKDGSEWQPTKRTDICSIHFAGNKKSNHPLNPSYVPTIFPEIYKKKALTASQTSRFYRNQKRKLVVNSTKSAGLDMDQLMQSTYLAPMNLAHGGSTVKREQQLDVEFVDVDGDLVHPVELSRMSNPGVDPLMSPRTFQACNAVSQDLSSVPEPHPFKQEVLENMKQEPSEMQFSLTVSHGAPDADQDLDPLQLFSLPESQCVIKQEVELDVKQEPLILQSGGEASEMNNPGPFISSADYSTSYSSSVEHKRTACDALYASPDHLIGCEKNYACDVLTCGATFTSSHQLTTHKQSHNGGRPKCGAAKSSPPARLKKTRSGRQKFVCDVCGAGITHRTNLIRHLKAHSGEKTFLCDTCGARFARSCDLAAHERTHSGYKPFVCDTCEARFTRISHLVRHKKSHSRLKVLVCECDTCGSKFVRSSLTVHMRSRPGDKTFVCDKCETRVARSSDLTGQRGTRVGRKRFVCVICGAKFNASSHLTKHERSHSGEKPYVCAKCGARFSQSSHLNRHEKSHSGEKPFVCAKCGARFSQKSHLNRHEKSHSGAKPCV